MFPGSFRAKLNSRFHRRASVFANHDGSRCTPPSSPPTHCSPMRIPSSTMTGWRAKNRTFLACVSLGTDHARSFLATRWTLQHALSEQAGVWDQFKIEAAFASLLRSREGKTRLYRYARRMSVTRLSFSPNKLIDYFPALWPARVNVHVSTRCLRTSCQTNS